MMATGTQESNITRWMDASALERMLLETAGRWHWSAPEQALRRLVEQGFVRIIDRNPDAGTVRYSITGRGRHLVQTRAGGRLCPACNGRGHNEINWADTSADEPFYYECEACCGTGVLPEQRAETWEERADLEHQAYCAWQMERRALEEYTHQAP